MNLTTFSQSFVDEILSVYSAAMSWTKKTIFGQVGQSILWMVQIQCDPVLASINDKFGVKRNFKPRAFLN